YSLVIGKKRTDGTYLPYIPGNKLEQEINFAFKDIRSFHHPYLGLTGSLFMDQKKVAPLEDPTTGYFLMSLNFGSSFFLGKQKLDAFVGISNLFDKNYLNHLSLYRPFGISM